MLNDSEIEQLEKGTLHLDCTRIELNGNIKGEARSYIGPGYIRQSPEHNFEIKIFVPGNMSFRDSFGFIGTQMGVLLTKDGSYSLKATDLQGRVWSTESIVLLDISGPVNGDGYIVSVSSPELLSSSDDPYQLSKPDLKMLAFGEVAFPTTSTTIRKTVIDKRERIESYSHDLARIKSCNLTIELRQDGKRVRLEATTSNETTSFHPQISNRLSESLQFILGVRIPWSYIAVNEGGTLVERITCVNEESWHESYTPLQFRIVDQTNCIWKLFDQYHEFVSQEKDHYQHPLSSQVWAVLNSDKANIEVKALVLTVAVETILDKFYGDVVTIDPATISAVDDLQKHIKGWGGDTVILKRVIGLITMIKTVRAGDQLKALVAKGIVTQSGHDAWKMLRNKAAHGDWKFVTENLQGTIDLLNQVRVLFYQLIFGLIGYKGMQTDYGTHGWPMIDYPPACTSTTTASSESN